MAIKFGNFYNVSKASSCEPAAFFRENDLNLLSMNGDFFSIQTVGHARDDLIFFATNAPGI